MRPTAEDSDVTHTGQPPRLFAFLRIPKTGGMALTLVLADMFGRHRTKVFAAKELRAERAAGRLPWDAQDYWASYDFIAGHMPLKHPAIVSIPPRPYVLMSVMRDPVDRAVSYYDDIRRRPQHPLFAPLSEMTLFEAIRGCRRFRHEVTLGQFRYIFGTDDAEEMEAALSAGDYIIGRSSDLLTFGRSVARVAGLELPVQAIPRTNVTADKPALLPEARTQEDFDDALKTLERRNLAERDFIRARLDRPLKSPRLRRRFASA